MNEAETYSGGYSGATGQTSGPGGGQATAPVDPQQISSAARQGIEQLKEAAHEHGGAAVQQVKEGAQAASEKVKEASRGFVHQQKDSLAEKVSEYAGAVRAISERLSNDEQGGGAANVLAQPASQAAEQLDRLTGYLRDADPADLLDDLGALARRRPEIVFGGLFVAGLAAARFLKASRPRPRSSRSGTGTPYSQPVASAPMAAPVDPYTTSGDPSPASGTTAYSTL